MSILEPSKIVMYEFWCDYVKPKYEENAKFCSLDTGSFLVYIKTKKFMQTLQRCWSYGLDKPLPKE